MRLQIAPDYGARRFIRMCSAAQAAKSPEDVQRYLWRSMENALWFEGVRADLRATTATEVGKQLFPEKYRKETPWVDARKDRRIERYASGESHFTKAYRDAASKIARKTPSQDVRVLLAALDVSRPIGGRATALLRTTCKPIQDAIFKQPTGPLRRAPSHISRRLGTYACTESVAALTILFRETVEQGDIKELIELGRKLYYMTLTWCTRWPIFRSHREIGFYFCCYIFPMARHAGLSLSVDPFHYFDCIDCLSHYVFQFNCFPRSMRMAMLDDLFQGWDVIWDVWTHGLVYREGLGPHLCLTEIDTASPRERREFATRLILKTWGWRALRLLECDMFPPDAIFDLMKKDPRTLTEHDMDGIETEEEVVHFRSWGKSPLRLRRERAAATR